MNEPIETDDSGVENHSVPVITHEKQKVVYFSRRLKNVSALSLLFISGAITVLITLGIFIFVFKETTPLILHAEQRNDMSLYHNTEENDEFERTASIFLVLDNIFGQSRWQPVDDAPLFSIWPLAVGTLKITTVALVEATVVGFFSAIAIAFYLPRQLRYTTKVVFELLAGMPTVVLGFLGLMVFATYFQSIFGTTYRLNAFVCGSVLSLTAIPIITTLFEEIYAGFPKDQIYSAKCSGLYDYQIITYLILPATWGKVFAAVLLGFGRCFGETMVVLMVSGNAAVLDLSLVSGARTMAATIGSEMAEVVVGDTHYSMLFLLGTLLIVATYLINFFSQLLIRKWTYD